MRLDIEWSNHIRKSNSNSDFILRIGEEKKEFWQNLICKGVDKSKSDTVVLLSAKIRFCFLMEYFIWATNE